MLRKIMAIVLFVVGLLLIFMPFIQDQIAVMLLNRHMEAIVPEEFEQNLAVEAEFDFSIIQSIDLPDLLAAWDEDLPIIGEIIIPDVDLHLPIIKGVSNSAISVGAGTMRPDQVMGEGNYPLASHHMNNPNLLFSPLERVEIEDLIYLRDLNQIYIYQVSHIEIIEPERVEVIEDQEQEGLITLITCTPDGTQRLMVRGELTEVADLNDPEEIKDLPIINALSGMDGDSSNEHVSDFNLKIAVITGIFILIGIGLFIGKYKRKAN